MGREYEFKYRANGAVLSAIQDRFEGFAPIQMDTAYYDTPEGDLSRLRWTLRRRLENGRSVCTAKTPKRDGSRGEWEVECPSILEAVPQLCALGAPKELMELAKKGFVEACAARFLRQAATLHITGCTVELALDQGKLLGGGRELPFAEVEVELKDGSEIVMVAFAEGLAKEFGLEIEPASKVQRAMALARGESLPR